MTLTVIIIGRNNAKTLNTCFTSTKTAIQNATHIQEAEFIYIDSVSTDTSLEIAKKHTPNIIKITDGFTTAAQGRTLGKLAAQYEALLFLDGDMELHPNWFRDSKDLLEQHSALRGQRHEMIYQNDTLVAENPSFDNIQEVAPVKRSGGFLMIKGAIVKDHNFTPLLLDEEESDFYSKFVHESKIYQVPVPAYKHHNYKQLQAKIYNYIAPFKNIGYLVSLLLSIKNGYFKGYILVQKKYILAILVSVLLYVSFILMNPILLSIAVAASFVNWGLRFISVILTALFLPYKLLCALIYLAKERSATVELNNHRFTIRANKPDFNKWEKALNAQKI